MTKFPPGPDCSKRAALRAFAGLLACSFAITACPGASLARASADSEPSIVIRQPSPAPESLSQETPNSPGEAHGGSTRRARTSSASEPLQTAQASSASQPRDGSSLLKGELHYCVPHGTPLKLRIASVPTSELEMLDRDLDGNLLPAHLNDPITSRVTEDLYVDDNKVIPEGTIFYGKVTKILPPRRLQQPGSLVISFDHLVTPSGREFAFEAEADNYRRKSKLKVAETTAAYAAGGAVVGAIIAYKVTGGMKAAIQSHGITVGSGAAAGALLATGYALMKKGHCAVLEPGDDLHMALDTDLLMPVAVEPAPKPKFANLQGVDIKIKKTKVISDGLDGHLIKMDVSITNNSKSTLRSIDLFLQDANGHRNPVVAGLDEYSEYIFRMEPYTSKDTTLYFQVAWPKLKRSLVWLNNESRQICYKQDCQ